MDFSSNLEVGTGRGDNLVDHRLAAEQPDEEVDGEEGKVEGEEEQHLEQEGTHGDEDAGGADVEVENKTQPGVVGAVGGVVTDIEPAEDLVVKTFDADEAVKEETEATLVKDVKATGVDSDLEASESETAKQESRLSDGIDGVTKVNVEDDWGDLEEAFGDEQEVAEGDQDVLGGDENQDGLLHADSNEGVGDGDGLDNGEDMKATDNNVVI